jgi:hypothetical protein
VLFRQVVGGGFRCGALNLVLNDGSPIKAELIKGTHKAQVIISFKRQHEW